MLTAVRHVCQVISPVVSVSPQRVGPQLSVSGSGVTEQAGLITRDSFLEGLAFLHWFDAVFTDWESLSGMSSHMIDDIKSASLFQTSNRRGVVVVDLHCIRIPNPTLRRHVDFLRPLHHLGRLFRHFA